MHIISKGGGIELKFLYSPAFFLLFVKGFFPKMQKRAVNSCIKFRFSRLFFASELQSRSKTLQKAGIWSKLLYISPLFPIFLGFSLFLAFCGRGLIFLSCAF